MVPETNKESQKRSGQHTSQISTKMRNCMRARNDSNETFDESQATTTLGGESKGRGAASTRGGTGLFSLKYNGSFASLESQTHSTHDLSKCSPDKGAFDTQRTPQTMM